MKNEIRFKLESKQRPKLAQEIGNILGTAPHYERVPSCAWCRENNHGYARTAKEFREQLAGYLGGMFADVTTRQKGNTYYKNFTITEETKELYAKEYGYEETEFLAG